MICPTNVERYIENTDVVRNSLVSKIIDAYEANGVKK